jgi:hypothetical protein
MAEKWTKTSSPDWRWMNPKPLLALNHFTVPCSLTYLLTFLLSYLRFSSASSRTAKRAASVNLQPLQTNLKVLQEPQTQSNDSTDLPVRQTNFSCGVCASILQWLSIENLSRLLLRFAIAPFRLTLASTNRCTCHFSRQPGISRLPSQSLEASHDSQNSKDDASCTDSVLRMHWGTRPGKKRPRGVRESAWPSPAVPPSDSPTSAF